MMKFLSMLVLCVLLLNGCQAASPSPAATQPAAPPTEAPTKPVAPPTQPPPPTEAPAPAPTLPAVLQAAPRQDPPLKVAVDKDIAYTKPLQAEITEKKMDIYRPEGAGPWPVIVVVPPLDNYRNTMTSQALGKAIAGQGAVVFTPDIGSQASYFIGQAAENNGQVLRQTLEETACALSFAKAKASDYAGNPENIIVMGYSAGALYGLDLLLQGAEMGKSWDALATKRGGPPAQVQCVALLEEPVAVDGFVSFGGYFDVGELRQIDSELAGILDPLALAAGNPGLKVTLLFNLAKLADVPLEATTALKDALAAVGHPVELFMVTPASGSISAKGPEVGWITNALLQYAK